jgi:hypothetical protein
MRLAVLLVSGLMLRAQDQATTLPPAVRTLVELARNAPPELTADAIIRLAEDGALPAGEPRSALLEEAFMAAGRAKEPMHLIPVPGFAPNTRAMFRGQASELRLDGLSLQSRLFKLVLPTDPEAARRLFESVKHPALEPAPCEDPFISDASAYYEMAGALAQSDQEPVALLEAALVGARSPGELAAFARALATVSLNSEQRDSLLGALAVKMENVGPDYRSFTTSVSVLRSAVGQYPSPALAVGFRRFLTKQMSAPRCEEDFGDATPAVDWFNAEFHGDLAVIGDEEVQPSQRLGGFKSETYFTTPDAKHIWGAFQQLKATPGAPEWRMLLSDFLRELSDWTPDGAVIGLFHQKITVLRGLVEAMPPGPDRDQVMGQSIAVLEYSGVEAYDPAEWLFQVKSLAKVAGEDSAKLMEAFRGSGDAGLALFAALGR